MSSRIGCTNSVPMRDKFVHFDRRRDAEHVEAQFVPCRHSPPFKVRARNRSELFGGSVVPAPPLWPAGSPLGARGSLPSVVNQMVPTRLLRTSASDVPGVTVAAVTAIVVAGEPTWNSGGSRLGCELVCADGTSVLRSAATRGWLVSATGRGYGSSPNSGRIYHE